jgi:hypothetical protein
MLATQAAQNRWGAVQEGPERGRGRGQGQERVRGLGPGAGEAGGGGTNGVTVKVNVVAPIMPPTPSLTVKMKLSLVLTAPLWTNTSRPALMSACVKLVIATPGAVVSSSWPFRRSRHRVGQLGQRVVRVRHLQFT